MTNSRNGWRGYGQGFWLPGRGGGRRTRVPREEGHHLSLKHILYQSAIFIRPLDSYRQRGYFRQASGGEGTADSLTFCQGS
jgi:hypothetical protein